jgi:hypothetical protein
MGAIPGVVFGRQGRLVSRAGTHAVPLRKLLVSSMTSFDPWEENRCVTWNDVFSKLCGNL